RCDRHREFERHAVVCQALHHLQQRDVRFGDRLKQPFFLEETLVLRVANEREMSVQNECKMAGHCGRFTASFRAKSRIPDANPEVYAAGSLDYASLRSG